MPVVEPSETPKSICLAGDQLTCERIRGAKQARVQSDSQNERFAGLVDMPSDWHALVTFCQVSNSSLYFVGIERMY